MESYAFKHQLKRLTTWTFETPVLSLATYMVIPVFVAENTNGLTRTKLAKVHVIFSADTYFREINPEGFELMAKSVLSMCMIDRASWLHTYSV